MLLSVRERVSLRFVRGFCEVDLLISEGGDRFLAAAVPVYSCICAKYAI